MTLIERKLTSLGELVEAGLVANQDRAQLEEVAARYAIAITPAVTHAIDPTSENDPIARQFVPTVREIEVHPRERTDPIGDRIKSPVPGIVHRYADRVLWKVASVCPVYCRFCFRREMIGPENGETLSAAELDAALQYIRDTEKIWEVILTGGDPFVLSPRRIREISSNLSEISHVKVLRWHTRVPVVDPERITDDLIDGLKSTRQTVFVGLHVNHAQELTTAATRSVRRLVDAGIPLVSQTVLLKGINDNPDTLESLMRRLVELRVKPYYLHHADLAPGTAHFRTTLADGRRLMAELRRRLSGLALPTYVLDLPGAYGKVAVERSDSNRFVDRDGTPHVYEDACAAPEIP